MRLPCRRNAQPKRCPLPHSQPMAPILTSIGGENGTARATLPSMVEAIAETRVGPRRTSARERTRAAARARERARAAARSKRARARDMASETFLIAMASCYAFFSGLEKFGDPSEEDMDVFYLTDFLARHFEKLVYEALGLTHHPELIDEYFKHYNRLVYLAQRNDDDLVDRAKKAARLLRLKFEIRPTGYGDLEPFISKL